MENWERENNLEGTGLNRDLISDQQQVSEQLQGVRLIREVYVPSSRVKLVTRDIH